MSRTGHFCNFLMACLIFPQKGLILDGFLADVMLPLMFSPENSIELSRARWVKLVDSEQIGHRIS